MPFIRRSRAQSGRPPPPIGWILACLLLLDAAKLCPDVRFSPVRPTFPLTRHAHPVHDYNGDLVRD